jgi:hypothetical protein
MSEPLHCRIQIGVDEVVASEEDRLAFGAGQGGSASTS